MFAKEIVFIYFFSCANTYFAMEFVFLLRYFFGVQLLRFLSEYIVFICNKLSNKVLCSNIILFLCKVIAKEAGCANTYFTHYTL
jgi:hypothetical protein